MSKRFLRWVSLMLAIALGVGRVPLTVYADTLVSPNYKFDESSLNGGGMLDSSSASYQFSNALGDTAVGNSASGNFQVDAGSVTTPDPALTFTVNGSGGNFPDFTSTGASVTTSTFTVSNYTSYGYIVQIAGNAPTYGSHTIAPMTTTGPSQTGIEQFGINLVANTSPSSVGANPNHAIFGVGSATANYGTSNVYRYVSGETIASAPKSSGVTTYTITYLVNVSSLTPGGKYTANQVVVCTGTY